MTEPLTHILENSDALSLALRLAAMRGAIARESVWLESQLADLRLKQRGLERVLEAWEEARRRVDGAEAIAADEPDFAGLLAEEADVAIRRARLVEQREAVRKPEGA